MPSRSVPSAGKPRRWRLGVAESLRTVARQERAHRRLVQRGDFQVEIGQVTATLVDEQLAVEVVVERTQLDEAEAPGDQAGRRRAARRQWDGVLLRRTGPGRRR